MTVPGEFLSFLQSEAERARDSRLQENRKLAIEYYNGEPFGDEVEGRSQLVTRDVSEVIDQQVINVLDTVIAGGRVVEFDGEGDDGTDYGQQATEAVRYQFMQKQNGYRVLHDALKSGLLEKTGIGKSWASREYDVTEGEIPAEMLTEAGDELIAAEPTDETEATWRVRAKVAKPIQFKDAAVPNEEFLIAPDARSLDEAAYVAHLSRKSIAELIKMGFERALVEQAYGDDPASQALSDARDSSRGNNSYDTARTGLARQVWLYEEYVRFDLNGDGFDELLQVFRVGQAVLSTEKVDEQPFSGWAPYPMQHRFVGQSSFDKTADIQRTRSVMLRQFMDNLYLSNSPRMYVDMQAATEDTIDDLLTVAPGRLIRGKGPNGTVPIEVPFVAGPALQAMELMTAERESRTGVTRQNQGLNPDTMNKTASGMAMLLDQGGKNLEYIARNFVQDFVAPMFAKRYRLMRKFGQPFSMKIDGQRVDIDPRQWPEEMDMLINVGLGTGRKDQRIAARTQLLEWQAEGLQAGSSLVDEEKIFNNVRGIIRDSALGSPSDYINDPKQLAEQNGGQMPQKPDPAAIEAQGKAQNGAAQVQADLQAKQQESALKGQQMAYDHEARMASVQADIQLKQDQAALQAQLARDKANMEADLAVSKQQFEMGLARERFEFERSLKADAGGGDVNVPSYRPGGDLAE